MVLDRARVAAVAESYDRRKLAVACVGSHSALDICDGAAEEGLRTLVVAQAGRERTFARYFRAAEGVGPGERRGVVDDCWVLPKYADILLPESQARLRAASAVFVPNRSFTSYAPLAAIEDAFEVPIFGSRAMLGVEERGHARDYYHLLERAGIPFPERVEGPEAIDKLVIVKLAHAKKRLERGFFTAASPKEFHEKAGSLMREGVIEKADLKDARIERYVVGPVFNLDMFYSPLETRSSALELLGVDWRFESSLDGHVRLPAAQQLSLGPSQAVPEYTVVGHNSATLRESLLEKAFEIGEKFVAAARQHYPPGIIGPFCLQTCVDKDLNFFVYDVAPRVGGGTNIHMSLGHPYGNALWRRPMSTGRRVALEVRRAAEEGKLALVVT
ncbi:MAG TPA: formate--phosphoribosylaminoimidazolecarboxamide ligase family protein [Candidatus Thermoplasmatota archaeon]|nr:formate--phosphoribosylaminoimidazolecarboxamide ligase family protein [Candidatus Thermoplasmatota archaeon]